MLDELIREELKKQRVSYRTAAARADGKVDYSTLSKIARGDYLHEYSDETLRGIALALAIPLSRVRKAAGKKGTEPPPFQVPDAAKYLSADQRRAVIAVINSMLSSRG